jgi:hypothetical protein
VSGGAAEKVIGEGISMKSWIGDYRIESALILPSEIPELKVTLQDSVFLLQNVAESDLATEALAAQIIVSSETIEDAEKIANARVREILDVLSFATGARFLVSRQRFLMDWTPGIKLREQYAYGQDKGDGRWPQFSSDYLNTVAELENLPDIKRLRTPLRWFAAGIRTQVAEDQFQYFWFVLELIAEITKETSPVSDKCQRCHTDLFCPSCNTISEHRPFAKQAIEALLNRLNVARGRQRDLLNIRNGIMHGRSREEIEEEIRQNEPTFEIGQAVDFIWRTAFMAIFNVLKPTQSQCQQMVFGTPDSIVSRTITFKAHMQIGLLGDPALPPRLENVVVPHVEAVRTNERGERIDPLTGIPTTEK